MVIKQRSKTIHVTIPEEVIFMALSREFYSKHQLGPKDAICALALEYAYNPDARRLLDQVLKNRLDPNEYSTDDWEFKDKINTQTTLEGPGPKDKAKGNKPMNPLEKRINDIWD